MGLVLSSALVGRFAIFGGDDYSIAVIDILERRLCTEVIKSPFEYPRSLEVCHGLGSNVYLSIGGSDPNYSSDVSDNLDVTRLYNGSEKIHRQVPEEINQSQTNLDKKDETIDTLKLKIEKLEADLLKEKKQNHGKSNQKNLKTKSTLFSRRTSYLNYKTRNCQINYAKQRVISQKKTCYYSKP